MASKFEHMGYVGVAVINDSERADRTLIRVFTSPNPPKDYLKQRRHSGSEEWTLVYDELVPNVDGKFGVLEFINTNTTLQNLAQKDPNRRLSTDAYFKGSSKDIISLIKTCVKSSSDALLRTEIVLATNEQLKNDNDFQQFTKERISKSESGKELLLAGGSIRDVKVLDAMRVLKEARYPLTLAAITKAIHGKGKNDAITPDEKEKTKDVLNILASSSFLNIVKDKDSDNSRFSAYPAFKIAQLKIMSQLLPSLNVMGQLGYLFEKTLEKPTEKTPYLTDPELEKKARIARLEENIRDQLKLYIDSPAFKSEKEDEFIKGVKNLITDFEDRFDVTTLKEANAYYDSKFTPEQKTLHERNFNINIREIIQIRRQKIKKSLTGEMVLRTFDSKDIETAKKEGEFNLLEADKAGFVYILYNRENRIFKIGETSRNPQGRANELSAGQDMPGIWQLARNQAFEGYVFSEDRQLLEALMHSRFARERFNKQREFFRSDSQTDMQFFDTLSAEVKTAGMAVRDFHHTGRTSYPFLEVAQKELESQNQQEKFKEWKANKEKAEEAQFYQAVGNTINNRNIEPIKNGAANPEYDNPLFVPIVQIMHYNFFRKDLKNNLRANPRTQNEIREQLTIFYPELSDKINNADIENAINIMKLIDPPIIKETIKPNSSETIIRFTDINKKLIDDWNTQLPKLNIEENLGYIKGKDIPENIDKKFTISFKTVSLMAALKADKRNKSLNELTNEMGLSVETVLDLMNGLNKETQANNVLGHSRGIFSIKPDKNDPDSVEMYGGNIKFTKSHIKELANRYPDAGFETIEVLFNDDNPKEIHKINSIAHTEVKVPMPIHEPAAYPEIIPDMGDVPLIDYDQVDSSNIVFEDDAQEWLSDIPDYPNPIQDGIDHENSVVHVQNVPEEKVIQISEKDIAIDIIKLLKMKGSPGSYKNEGQVTAKKTLTPDEISSELNINVNLVIQALDNFEKQQVNPLYVRDFQDRKVYGMDYKIKQEDLMNLNIFDVSNIEHRKVLSLFNKENPNNFYKHQEASTLAQSAETAKASAEKINVAESLCPKALREIENLMPEQLFEELRKLASDNPEELIKWLKEGKSNKSTLKM